MILNRIIRYGNWRIKLIIRQLLLMFRTITKPNIVSIYNVQLPIPVPIPAKIKGGPLKALYAGYYEQEELDLLNRHLDKDDIVMEVGTGLGLLAAFSSIELGSDKVVTYEANPSLQSYIEQTFSLNQVNPSFKICMLGEVEGEETFYVNKDFWCSSTIPSNNDTQAIKVPVIPFQQELEKISPTLLLIDIEGGEYELLKSANLDTVKKIIMELHVSKLGEEKANFVLERLKEQGFSLIERSPRGCEFFFKRLSTA